MIIGAPLLSVNLYSILYIQIIIFTGRESVEWGTKLFAGTIMTYENDISSLPFFIFLS